MPSLWGISLFTNAAPPKAMTVPKTPSRQGPIPASSFAVCLQECIVFFNESPNAARDTILHPKPANERRERRIVPGNVYYVMPYYHHFFYLYGFLGGFSCSWISDYVSSATTAIIWTSFVISCLVLILTHPLLYSERKRVDEGGKEVTLRRPVIGLKACEVELDLEGIANGLYDPEDGNVDPRLHDGYRYGRALLRD